ncbi:Uncharacterised protein [Bordetella pertussis]|nr:Uncharacterised protein [Bordetella pertussis]
MILMNTGERAEAEGSPAIFEQPSTTRGDNR